MARYSSWTGTVLCIIVAMEAAAATQLKVGDNHGWAPPSGTEKETYAQWAERYRFLINDTLVFTYNPSVDSVLVVNKQDFDTCNTSNPSQTYKDGNTIFHFPKHGPFYFISGNATNCQKGEKLVVVVLSPRAKSTGAPSPSPSSSTVATSSPSPSNVASPSPSPSTGAPSSMVSPSVAPAVSPTVASVPSPAGAPSMAPVNSATQIFSPAPSPLGSEGGVVPSASAGFGIHPCLVSAAMAVLAVFFSGAY